MHHALVAPTPPETIRVGIVGCGFILDQHLRSLRRLRGLRIVGVADPCAEARQAAARSAGAPAFADTTALLREAAPHVVHVLTPPHAHCEVALEAIAAGCHVLLEKPMSVSVGEADEMLAAARRAGVRLCVSQNFLYMPIVAEARRLAASGALGRIVGTECFWRPAVRIEQTPWAHALPGGVLQEMTHHTIYLQRAFLGPLSLHGVRPVRGANGYLEGVQILLDSEAGPGYASLLRSPAPKQHALRVYGTKMSLELEISANTLVKLRRAHNGKLAKGVMNLDRSAQILARTLRATLGAVRGRSLGGHDVLAEEFYRTLRQGGAVPSSGETDREVIALLEPVWRELATADRAPLSARSWGGRLRALGRTAS